MILLTISSFIVTLAITGALGMLIGWWVRGPSK